MILYAKPGNRKRIMNRRSLIRIILLAIFLEFLLILLISGRNPARHPVCFFGSYFAMFIFFLFSFQTLRRGTLGVKYSLSIIILFSIIYRLTFLLYKPFLIIPDMMENYSLLSYLSVTILQNKLIIFLCDMGIIGLLIVLLKNNHIQPQTIVIYAWNPLVLLEFCGAGRMTVYPIFLFLGLLYFLEKNKNFLFTGTIILSALTSLKVLFLFPWLFLKKQSRSFIILFVFVLLICLFPLFFFKTQVQLILTSVIASSLNSFGFRLISFLTNSNVSALIIFLLLIAIILFFCAWKKETVFQYLFCVFGIFFLLAPAAIPTTFIWIIPFLCFNPKGSWLYLNAAVVLVYTTAIPYYFNGKVQVDLLIQIVEYTPFFVLLIYEYLLKTMKRHRNIVA